MCLHFYNPSEAVSFSYLDNLRDLSGGSQLLTCTLRVEPEQAAHTLLASFHYSKMVSSLTQIKWTQIKTINDTQRKVLLRYSSLNAKEATATSNITSSASSLDTIDLLGRQVRFEIGFNITAHEDRTLSASFEYLPSKVSRELACSILHTFNRVLNELSKSPLKAIDDFSPCSEYDRQLIQRFTSRISSPENCLIHDLVLAQCYAKPAAQAICSLDGDMTYGELDQLTLRLAHHLVSLGVGPEVFVLSCFEKSTLAIVARLAILRAGGAYSMIDAEHPPTYLDSIIRRTGAQILLTTPKFTSQFGGLVPTTVEITSEWLWELPASSSPPLISTQPDNACLVLFTSGSTGHPKGIIQTHRSYATALRDYNKAVGVDADSRVLQFDTYAFDISNNDYLAPLIAGGCCCVPTTRHGIHFIVEDINALNANMTFLTPTVAIQINPEEVKCLKTICVGGEVLPKDLIAKWTGRVKLINQYGMSEVATFCAYNDQPSIVNPASIGRPGCGAIWIVSLSSPERLMPVGAIGEILMEGPNLARGYLDGAIRTSGARFLDAPPSWMAEMHPDRRSSRMYLSGDLARYNHDGTIEYVGRKDLILKLDGCKIDAVEVEHCARKCLSTNDAIIVDLLGGIREMESPALVAYLYLHDHPQAIVKADDTAFLPTAECPVAEAKAAQMKDSLSGELPKHMVPTVFLLVNCIPRTASRKVDRKKLHMQAEAFWSKIGGQKSELGQRSEKTPAVEVVSLGSLDATAIV